ncbi:MAG: hypothetical protein ACYS0J_19510 [Planctomycetota bacterium]
MPLRLNEAGRYGSLAMELLIENMLQRGARKEDLRAKSFGGGDALHPAHRPRTVRGRQCGAGRGQRRQPGTATAQRVP